jgi:hypothetical protein
MTHLHLHARDEDDPAATLRVEPLFLLANLWHAQGDGDAIGCALRVVVPRGFTHDMADLLLKDVRRQLPRPQAQPEPVHDAGSAAGFHD